MLPMLIAVLVIGFGAGTLAGEEERGTLDLVLAYPVHRRRVVLEKVLVLVLQVVLITVVVYLVTFGVGRGFDISVPLGNVVQSALGQLLLGACLGFLALATGACTGSRGLAVGVAAGAAAGTYLVGSLAPVVSWMGPLKWVSPFYYATGGNPLAAGIEPWHVAVLVGLAASLLGVALVGFDRRDLRG